MKNIAVRLDGDLLHITLDLSKEYGRSMTGKTIMVATTSGNRIIPGVNPRIRVGVNVFKYPEYQEKKNRPKKSKVRRRRVKLFDVEPD